MKLFYSLHEDYVPVLSEKPQSVHAFEIDVTEELRDRYNKMLKEKDEVFYALALLAKKVIDNLPDEDYD